MNRNKNIITIDGPACSGKGTLSRRVAEHFGWLHLDSGLLYRSLAYVLLQHRISPEQVEESIIEQIAKELKFDVHDRSLSVSWNNYKLGNELRTEQVGHWASLVAREPITRQVLLKLQRSVAQKVGQLVADGRDMGTTVFPDAQFKFFLVAPLDVRAKRRFEDQRIINPLITYEAVLEQLKKRDLRDTERSIAPLKQAEDAIPIDTGSLSIEESFKIILSHVEKS